MPVTALAIGQGHGAISRECFVGNMIECRCGPMPDASAKRVCWRYRPQMKESTVLRYTGESGIRHAVINEANKGSPHDGNH